MRSRKHRPNALVPAAESLEGRRLLAANPAQIRIQEVATGATAQLIITGTSRADAVTIDDSGGATAGNVKVTLGDGRTYVSKGAISLIQVNGGQGADRVTYNLTGDLVAARTMTANLGAGADVFSAQIQGAIRTTGLFDLEAVGGAGNDALTVDQSAATAAGTFFPYLDGGAGDDTVAFRSAGDVGVSATVGPALLGGAGNDAITLDASGQVLGSLLYNNTIDGGAGNDTINAHVAVKSGSSGNIGASAAQPAVVTGGDGNDQVRFAIDVDPESAVSQVFALAVGGSGHDVVQRTANLLGNGTNENEALLS